MFVKQDIPIIDTLGALARGDWGGALREGMQDVARLWMIWVWWLGPRFVAGHIGVSYGTEAIDSVIYTLSAPLVLMPFFIWLALRARDGHRANLALAASCLGSWFLNFHRAPAAYGFSDLNELTLISATVWFFTGIAAVLILFSVWLITLDTPTIQAKHKIKRLFGLRELDGGADWSTQAEMSRRFTGKGGIIIAHKVVKRV